MVRASTAPRDRARVPAIARVAAVLACALAALLPQFDLMAQSSRDWRRAGFDSYEARPWAEAGLTPEEAIWWGSVLDRQLYLNPSTHPSIAGVLKSNGLILELAREWFSTFGHESIHYTEGQIVPSNYLYPTDELEIATEYLLQNIPFEEAKQWREHYIGPPYVVDWKNMGLTPDQAGEWRRTGRRSGFPVNPSLVESLMDAGFDAATYAEWAAFIGSHGVDIARTWVLTGLGLDVADLYAHAGLRPNIVSRIRKECHGDPQSRGTTVYLSNPFAAEGSCFFVEGRVHQLLNRASALASHPTDSRLLAYVDFAPRAAPAERASFFVLAKADAPYRYTTVLGDERIVVNLSVLEYFRGAAQ